LSPNVKLIVQTHRSLSASKLMFFMHTPTSSSSIRLSTWGESVFFLSTNLTTSYTELIIFSWFPSSRVSNLEITWKICRSNFSL
jgi:hypothetical protein